MTLKILYQSTDTKKMGILGPSLFIWQDLKGQFILALTNPHPEIGPELAPEGGACFSASEKNVNNVLGFPGLFKGIL